MTVHGEPSTGPGTTNIRSLLFYGSPCRVQGQETSLQARSQRAETQVLQRGRASQQIQVQICSRVPQRLSQAPPTPRAVSFRVWLCWTGNPPDDPHHPAFQMKLATLSAQLIFPGAGWALCQQWGPSLPCFHSRRNYGSEGTQTCPPTSQHAGSLERFQKRRKLVPCINSLHPDISPMQWVPPLAPFVR